MQIQSARAGRDGDVVLRCFLFAWVVLGEAVLGTAYIAFPKEAASLPSLLWALPFLGAWIALAALPGERAVSRVFLPASVAASAAVFAVSLWFMRVYRYEPLWDPAALLYGAEGWAQGDLLALGSATYQQETYFYYFPNNLGATAFLALWFRIVGAQDAYLSACALNALLLSATVLCTTLAAREIAGHRAGLCALALLVCTPPLWLSGAAFYTDFLSICFPVAGLWLALRAERAGRLAPRAALRIGAALTWAVGAMVKITVLIAPIAYVLWQAARRDWKSAGAVALAAALSFGALAFSLDRAVYPSQLDPKKARQMNTPVEHWVMMGLRGDGVYNGVDYAFTRSFADPAQRREAVRQEILNRLRERGPMGLARHLLRKAGYALSDGTLMLSDYYDDFPQAPPFLQDLLLPGGERYGLWQGVSGGAHLAMLLLGLAGAVREGLRRGQRAGGCVFLAVFGLMLFLTFWEASRRYWINFLPLFILCAALGLAGDGEMEGTPVITRGAAGL